MSRLRLLLGMTMLVITACSTVERQGTIAELRNQRIEITDERLDDGLEKAMSSYHGFLAAAPQSALAPEAIRRLADLKVEKEYGLLTTDQVPEGHGQSTAGKVPEMSPVAELDPTRTPDPPAMPVETEADFASRASDLGDAEPFASNRGATASGPRDLERAGPLEAVALYQKLLDEYPLYDRNDQVLYQMSRAYEELGRVEDAMQVMNRLVGAYSQSPYLDEVQFRRAEFYFTRRQYLDAEEAYRAIVTGGEGSSFYPFALYKLGWTFYKQELYEDALDHFFALLDYKVSIGDDFEQTEDETERKRTEDTFRVISLSFSYLGGADVVAAYFSKHGARSYEDLVYSNLGEYYFDKRRYSDANAAYSAFVARNPFHFKAPNFQMRIIEINTLGGFPSLVLESKKAFANSYDLDAEYWQHFDPEERPEVLNDLKTNLKDLANHYHALYRKKELKVERPAHFAEALHWYRELLDSFPQDDDSPAINYQMADLLMENRSFDQAALAYEKTAYEYPVHDKSATAGYAAVYAYREHLGTLADDDRAPVKREVVRSSVRFAETFPEHAKAAVVLGAAVDDLYAMEEYEQAVLRAAQLVESFPEADDEVRRSAWIVIGHASYELERYAEAETAYLTVLEALPDTDERHAGLVDNLAASIYRQAENANAVNDFQAAADHFLRVGRMAPASAIRPNAEYDAATALIRLEDWGAAAGVLNGFRQTFPDHALQPEVTKKLAYVYRQDGRPAQAAMEYERIETETKDNELRREALLTAGELYEEAGDRIRTLKVYQRYVAYFEEPVEVNVETRNKIGLLLKAANDQDGYLEQLGKIVDIDATAGSRRTPRTRYLASRAALVLAEGSYARFTAVRLVNPIETSLRNKQALMKEVTSQFKRLLDYEVAEVTAASTYYLAEVYAHFSAALLASERPGNLTPLELEQYELAIEEQAYPFEEKAIEVHASNLELIAMGIYNTWIEKSLQKLAEVMPARYDRPEAESPVMMSLESYIYELENRTGYDGPVEKSAADQQPSAGDEQGTTDEPDGTGTEAVPVNKQDASSQVASQAVHTDADAAQQQDTNQ